MEFWVWMVYICVVCYVVEAGDSVLCGRQKKYTTKFQRITSAAHNDTRHIIVWNSVNKWRICNNIQCLHTLQHNVYRQRRIALLRLRQSNNNKFVPLLFTFTHLPSFFFFNFSCISYRYPFSSIVHKFSPFFFPCTNIKLK